MAYHEVLVPVPILVEEEGGPVPLVLVHGPDVGEVNLKKGRILDEGKSKIGKFVILRYDKI